MSNYPAADSFGYMHLAIVVVLTYFVRQQVDSIIYLPPNLNFEPISLVLIQRKCDAKGKYHTSAAKAAFCRGSIMGCPPSGSPILAPNVLPGPVTFGFLADGLGCACGLGCDCCIGGCVSL